jgi:cation transport regulator ChaC
MLHFAYGSNMDRAVMLKHAPAAEPVGVASLANHRFVITADGYASVEPARGQTVHGVLWRLTPRDRVVLNIWENVASGRYGAEMLPVHRAGRRRPALVYVARLHRAGWPKPGYMELVVAAARAWNLPPDYTAFLQRWLPPRPLRAGAAGARKFGEFAGT